MKRILKLLLVLALLYFLFQMAVKFLSKTSISNYMVKTNDYDVVINEIFTNKVKDEFDNYYFNIDINGDYFTFQTFEGFYRNNNIIEDVYYFKGAKYSCILPVFDGGKIISDIVCKEENSYYNFQDIQDSEVSTFATELESIGYDYKKYADNSEVLNELDKVLIYDVIEDNQFYTVENYKGIYVFGSLRKDYIYNSSLFSSDIYTKKLSTFVDKYYVVADYNMEDKFNNFIVINTVNNTQEVISFDFKIDFNSYIQGVIGNSVYIYDKANKIQYELNLDKEKVIEIGNNEEGMQIYINGEYQNVALDDEYKFNEYTTDNIFNDKKYYKVDKVGKEVSGYYYIYEKKLNKYNVYQSSIQDGINMKYLFTVENIDNIVYTDKYILFVDSKYIKRYSQDEGVKTLFSDSELEFNDSIKFNMVIK